MAVHGNLPRPTLHLSTACRADCHSAASGGRLRVLQNGVASTSAAAEIFTFTITAARRHGANDVGSTDDTSSCRWGCRGVFVWPSRSPYPDRRLIACARKLSPQRTRPPGKRPAHFHRNSGTVCNALNSSYKLLAQTAVSGITRRFVEQRLRSGQGPRNGCACVMARLRSRPSTHDAPVLFRVE